MCFIINITNINTSLLIEIQGVSLLGGVNAYVVLVLLQGEERRMRWRELVGEWGVIWGGEI